jgi:hypothetical protein
MTMRMMMTSKGYPPRKMSLMTTMMMMRMKMTTMTMMKMMTTLNQNL